MMRYHAERPGKTLSGHGQARRRPLDCTIHAGYVTGLVGPDGGVKPR